MKRVIKVRTHLRKGRLVRTHLKSIPVVTLEDDGSLDTVISVNGKTIRYDPEYASQFRNKRTGAITEKGWGELKAQAIEDATED